ncbi:MAG TPA: 3-isopropylmalate dehydratase small subunit [Pseudolabrys sp.]|jgi:3-isopropylmalate/(R)-2-methylmalate dehydratase small subunit|nr:3-isopropylmalate dehydratase small subunit [Pseudolabrys sp.]
MEKFTQLSALAAPLMRPNIDTDAIIPVKRLIGYQRHELGAFALEPYRFRADGSENPDFVLNQPRYRGAKILVTAENFGCGSSRESAVWALMAYGFRCVIAPGFGDIFTNNAFQNGLLLIRLPREEVDRIAEELGGAPSPAMAIDLQSCTITTPAGRQLEFQIDGERRQALLEGRDEIAMTLLRDADIAAFQSHDRVARPWIYQTVPAA